jgi:hypothetical protein
MVSYVCQVRCGWERQIAEDVRQQLLWEFGQHIGGFSVSKLHDAWSAVSLNVRIPVIVVETQCAGTRNAHVLTQLDWSSSEVAELQEEEALVQGSLLSAHEHAHTCKIVR